MKNIEPKTLIDFKKHWNIDEDSKPSFDAIFMQISLLMASRASCKRARYGAVITLKDRILGVGYNGSPSRHKECGDKDACELDTNGSCFDSIHAEQNAIANCIHNGISLEGASIYVQTIPCISCAKLIVASGIKDYYCIDENYRIKDGKEYLQKYGVKFYLLDMNIE